MPFRRKWEPERVPTFRIIWSRQRLWGRPKYSRGAPRVFCHDVNLVPALPWDLKHTLCAISQIGSKGIETDVKYWQQQINNSPCYWSHPCQYDKISKIHALVSGTWGLIRSLIALGKVMNKLEGMGTSGSDQSAVFSQSSEFRKTGRNLKRVFSSTGRMNREIIH